MNIYVAVDHHGALHWAHLKSIRDLWVGSGQMAGIVKVWADTMPVTVSDCVDLAAAQGLSHLLVVPVADDSSDVDGAGEDDAHYLGGG